MKIITSVKAMHEYVQNIKKHKQKISFIPTMGALHAGHVSLIETAYAKNKESIIIVSIFVNPTQFTEKQDFEKYPQNIEKDKKKLEHLKIEKNIEVDCIFAPTDFYNDIEYQEFQQYTLKKSEIILPKIFFELEGKTRVGHFEGVYQVLFRFFSILQPNYAVFGRKDFQQTLLVQYLQKQFFPTLQIFIADVFREKSGLAMSSRNARLSLHEREKAKIIYEAMYAGMEKYKKLSENNTPVSVREITDEIIEILSVEKLVENVHYVEIRTRETFEKCTVLKNEKYVILVSVHFSGIHLIDVLEIE